MQRIRNIETVREKLREICRLEEVVQGYGLEPTPAGQNHVKAVCPFHEDTDPSFAISTSKQLFYCHGCHEGGDVFNFIQKIDNVSHVGSIRTLAERAGFDLTPFKAELTEEEKRQQKLYDLNDTVAGLTATNLGDERCIEWIESRRLGRPAIDEYDIGFSDSLPAKGEKAKRLGFRSKQRWSGGVVVVPIFDDYGRVCSFRNRRLDGKPKVVGPGDNHPLPVPPLYGFYQARGHIRKSGAVILVEGEVDVWQMWSHGYQNVCGLMGSSMTEEQLDYLAERGVREVVLLPDADQAGRKLAMKVARSTFDTPVRIKIANLEEGDPDEALLADPEIVEIAIEEAKYSTHYLVDHVLRTSPTDTITDKIDVLSDLREALAGVAEVERSLAVDLLAESLGMDRASIDDFFREGAAEESKLYDVYAERVVISRCLNDLDFLGDAVLDLKPSDFYLERHRTLFGVMADLYRSGDEVGPGVVQTLLRNRGDTVVANYVDSVAGVGEGVAGAGFFLAELRDKSVRRQVKDAAQDTIRSIDDLSSDARSGVAAHMAKLADILVGREQVSGVDSIVEERMDLMHRMMEDPATIIGLDFGEEWFTLNHALHGLQRKRYMVLAAPSSVGKTAVACQWMKRFAVDQGEPTLCLTFETGKEAIADRIVANISGVPTDQMITGYVDEEDAVLIHDAAVDLAAAPLVISESGRVFEEAQAIIRHDVLRRGTRVVFVDYLQLMRLQDAGRRSRYSELGQISGSLLELAKELEISVVALAQINREGAKKSRSTKLDIGDSFIIAQDADAFFILDNKTDDEIETQGIDSGDKFGFLDKNRHGKDKLGFHLQSDMDVQKMWEVDGPTE